MNFHDSFLDELTKIAYTRKQGLPPIRTLEELRKFRAHRMAGKPPGFSLSLGKVLLPAAFTVGGAGLGALGLSLMQRRKAKKAEEAAKAKQVARMR